MNAAAARSGLDAYGHTPSPASYAARRPAGSPYLETLDRDTETYTYTAPPSAYRATWAVDRAGRRARTRRLTTGAILALVLLLLAATILTGALKGAAAAGLRLSRYHDTNAAGALAPGLSAPAIPTPAAAPAAAAPPARGAAATRTPQARHTAEFAVAAPPSVSAGLIDRVLDSYHSPATGNGALFYDLGVKYGIDPAYALAFYIHESAAGTKGVARFTHGIGNIRTTSGYADYEGYRSYATYAAGIEDWYQLIKELYVDGWGLRTPDAILVRYAPWGDNNNPAVYATAVKQLVDSWQGQ